MGRSGYSDECDGWALIRWRGAVASAIRGKRGQAVLHEIAAALDALPEKTLAAQSLVADGEFCTLGALGRARGMDLHAIDPEDYEAVAKAFSIPRALAQEIMFINDEHIVEFVYQNVEFVGPQRPWESHCKLVRTSRKSAAEDRWAYMRRWVNAQMAVFEEVNS